MTYPTAGNTLGPASVLSDEDRRGSARPGTAALRDGSARSPRFSGF
jgi:hypothetical protein